MLRTRIYSGLLGAALVAMAGPASAQDAPLPGKSTETFGDWSVECTTAKVSPPADTAKGDRPAEAAERICEAVQSYRDTKSNTEIARLAFGISRKEGEAGKILAGMRMIVDVSFAEKPKVVIGDEPAFEGKMQRCLGNFCYAAFALDDEETKPLEEAAAASLRFPIAGGQIVAIAISPEGLTDALKVLRARSK